MFQKIAATLATVLIATVISLPTTANAGCGGGHKGLFKSSSSSYSIAKKRRARAAAIKRAKARKLATLKAKKKAKARKLAALKAEKKAKALAAAKKESTFVEATSTAAVLTKVDANGDANPVNDVAKPEKVAVLDVTKDDGVIENADTGCKRYIPAIGKTITVTCE